MNTIKIPFFPPTILQADPDRPGWFTNPVAPIMVEVPKDVFASWGLMNEDGRVTDARALQDKAEQWYREQESVCQNDTPTDV